MKLFPRFRGSKQVAKSMTAPVPSRGHGGWFSLGGCIKEMFSGAWQRNKEHFEHGPLANPTVFTCTTLIASDVAKLRVKLMRKNDTIWEEYTDPNLSRLLRKPNSFQTRNQFFEAWTLSKLKSGNTYVLKQYDRDGNVSSMYVLDPSLVLPLVADNGDVFYQLNGDNLSGISEGVTVPASFIIHDRFNCLFHPLVGLSPLFSAAMPAIQAQYIIGNSTEFFGNGSTRPGILTAPGAISEATATRLKEHWEANYTGNNSGKIAVLGDGLKFEAMSMSAVDSQLIEQLQWSARTVAGIYHVPTHKIGIESPPNYSIDALDLAYYTQCLQPYLEAAESCLDDGLGLNSDLMGTEFDIDGLVRMDQGAMVEAEKNAVGAGIKSPNEARRRFDLPPVSGGTLPYLQQQNYSLEALARRDAQVNPFDDGTDKEQAQTTSTDNREDQKIKLQIALAKKLGLKQISIA